MVADGSPHLTGVTAMVHVKAFQLVDQISNGLGTGFMPPVGPRMSKVDAISGGCAGGWHLFAAEIGTHVGPAMMIRPNF